MEGFITPGPNCTTVGFGHDFCARSTSRSVLNRVLMTSMQALSGAGRSPGVTAMDILDNIIPYIPKEEEKVERRPPRIWASWPGTAIVPAAISVSCTCTRRECARRPHRSRSFVQLKRPAVSTTLRPCGREFGRRTCRHGSAFGAQAPHCDPREIPIGLSPAGPRTRRAAWPPWWAACAEDPALPNGLKYILVSHNTRMGAAKGPSWWANTSSRRAIFHSNYCWLRLIALALS